MRLLLPSYWPETVILVLHERGPTIEKVVEAVYSCVG